MPPKAPKAPPKKGRRVKDEAPTEEFFVPQAVIIKPDDQLQLSEKEMNEELTRCVLERARRGERGGWEARRGVGC